MEKDKGEEEKEGRKRRRGKKRGGGRRQGWGGEKECESSAGDNRPLGTTAAHTLAWWVEVCCAFQVRISALEAG